MVQPLSLLPRSVVAGALAGLLGLQHGARAVHVNHTIEDSDIVNFGCTVTACDATSTQYDPCNENNVENRTFTIVTPVFDSCSLKVPFNGIAIYAFVSCTTLPGCQVEVDKIGDTGWPQSYVIQTDPAATVLPLGYFNDSLSNGPHILTISSTEFFLVDKFIYTIDDGSSDTKLVPSAGSSKSTRNAGASTSTTLTSQSSLATDVAGSMSAASTSQSSPPSTALASSSSKKSATNIAVILGSAIGGLIFGAAIMITVLVWCRRLCVRTREHQENGLQPHPPPASWSSDQNLSRNKRRQPLALRISICNKGHGNASPPYRPELRDEEQGEVQEGVADPMQGGNDCPPPEYFA